MSEMHYSHEVSNYAVVKELASPNTISEGLSAVQRITPEGGLTGNAKHPRRNISQIVDHQDRMEDSGFEPLTYCLQSSRSPD